jgi:4-hydroxy-3-methylbut-2-enyl diphosphate reductase
MARNFAVPDFYRSELMSTLKRARLARDSKKQDLTPTILDVGPLRFKIARHFGFCFGVENAIEIAYRALDENPSKRVFLLSEMIHNPHVNSDLLARGVKFLMGTDGTQLIPFSELHPEDIVIVPAFGTTVALFQKLRDLGIEPTTYNATCPFVEKVWKRSAELGKRGFSIVVHGKHTHEETRATFSHASEEAPTIVILDMTEAQQLARVIRGELALENAAIDFAGRVSNGFDFGRDLQRIGVVNQTTMLATDTHAISALLREAIIARYGEENVRDHFADTRDTLCYATYENQEAVRNLIASGGDIAVVVGGYNSSNTSHLVELCAESVPTYHIKDAAEILSAQEIRHFDWAQHSIRTSPNWLPERQKQVALEILITAGASCPDALVDAVLQRIVTVSEIPETLPTAVTQYLVEIAH